MRREGKQRECGVPASIVSSAVGSRIWRSERVVKTLLAAFIMALVASSISSRAYRRAAAASALAPPSTRLYSG